MHNHVKRTKLHNSSFSITKNANPMKAIPNFLFLYLVYNLWQYIKASFLQASFVSFVTAVNTGVISALYAGVISALYSAVISALFRRHICTIFRRHIYPCQSSISSVISHALPISASCLSLSAPPLPQPIVPPSLYHLFILLAPLPTHIYIPPLSPAEHSGLDLALSHYLQKLNDDHFTWTNRFDSSSVDSDTRSSVDSDTRLNVDSDTRSSADSDTRSSVDSDTRSSVDSDTRSSVDSISDTRQDILSCNLW